MTEADPLETVDLFATLEPADRAQLTQRGDQIRLSPHQLVYRHGEAATHLYVVLEGRVVVYRDAIGQPMQLLAHLGPGDHFGELVLFGEEERKESAKCESPTRLVRFARERFLEFLGQRPSFALRIQIAAARRRSEHSAAALDLGRQRDVRIRLAAAGTLLDRGVARAILLENLSTGGLCLSGAPDRWQPGDEIDLELSFSVGAALSNTARVRWRQGDAVGLEFVDAPADQDVRVRKLVHALLHG